MKRRNFLELLGLSGILPFIGKPDKVTSPLEVSPAVPQAPRHNMSELHSHVVPGSISVYDFPSVGESGSGVVWTIGGYESYEAYQHQLRLSQLYNGRNIAPVLGGFDDDGGAG